MTLQRHRRSQLDLTSAAALSDFLQCQSADTAFLAQQAALYKLRQRQGNESFFRMSYQERRQWREDTKKRIEQETRKFEACKLQIKRDRCAMLKIWKQLDVMLGSWLRRLKADGVYMGVWLEAKNDGCEGNNNGGDDMAIVAKQQKEVEERERILERTRMVLEKCQELRKRGLLTPRAPSTNSSGCETSDAGWSDDSY